MVNTFKETVKSLADADYANHIIKKTLKSAIWYFVSYVLLLSAIPLSLAIILITYFVPQFPSIISTKVPDGYISLKNGILETNYPPYQVSMPDRVFSFDPQETVPENLDSLSVGFYIYNNGIVHIESDNDPLIQEFSDVSDFQLEKGQLVSWISSHLGRIWLALFGLTLIVVALGVVIFLLIRAVMLLLWSAVLWIFSRALNKSLSYLQAFKLSLYAAVPSLIISGISTVTDNQYLGYLSLGLFIFLSGSWVWNIKVSK